MNSEHLKIDTLRGLACVLLVAYHVIGSNSLNGLRISDGFYRELNDILAYLRMPLFTFLSGLVYAYRPVESKFKSFLIKKVRRLLLPMLTVGTLFAVLQAATPNTNTAISHWYLLHIIPVAHFWFIESLFILFLFITMLEMSHAFKSFRGYLIIMLCMCGLYLSPIDNNYLSFSGFIYLAPFFLLGMGIPRYKFWHNFSPFQSLLITIFVAVCFFSIYMEFVPLYEKRSLVGLILGGASCVALLSLGLKSSYLAKIGVFSYSIYLFHAFFTASTRMFMNKIDLYPLEGLMLASLIMGIAGPIVIEKVLGRINITRVMFLGKSALKMRTVGENKTRRIVE